MGDTRGVPLGGEAITLANTTDEAHVIPWTTYRSIRRIGIVTDADVFVAIDTSATPRADLATTGVLITGPDEVVLDLLNIGASGSSRQSILHIAAASTAGCHINYYR